MTWLHSFPTQFISTRDLAPFLPLADLCPAQWTDCCRGSSRGPKRQGARRGWLRGCRMHSSRLPLGNRGSPGLGGGRGGALGIPEKVGGMESPPAWQGEVSRHRFRFLSQEGAWQVHGRCMACQEDDAIRECMEEQCVWLLHSPCLMSLVIGSLLLNLAQLCAQELPKLPT